MSGQRHAPINDPVIRKSPLFADFSELEFNAAAAFLEPRQVKSGEVVINEGAAGEEMFVLISGGISAWVSQADGTQRLMFEIRPGNFFGEMSVIANETRSATLIAKEDSELMVLQGIDFYRIVFEHPMIGVKMLKAIGREQNFWLEQNSKYLGDLMRWGETARRRAVTDDLTGLYNRRFLEETGGNCFEKGKPGLRSVSLLMIDLDNIHKINDSYGIKAGDLVFISVAEVLRSITRAGDICARLSGDEFAVLLPDTVSADARVLAERLRSTLASRKVFIPLDESGTGRVGIIVHGSIGVAAAMSRADSWEGLYMTADAALHRAKELGKNRVEVADSLCGN